MIIDNINYEHRLSNFIEAKNHALKLVGLLKGCIRLDGDKVDIDIGAIVSNIGSPEMQGIEQFILKYVTVTDADGNTVLLQKPDVFNQHFNTYRSHYFQLIIDGVKFHFADFLPGGVASVVSMPNLAALNLQ
ncbi:putative phage tail assembly chaperone [Photorhabdus sp. P32]|uniref:phage tail assembly chaperone n=1 Tax=Photorhabdus sp. P32 TaxID=3117549 RepID=UPI002AB3AA74|nr:putative phage tail assembly chaperone [Bacillus thuringiensis]MDY7522453.1 putative phage tail assembly chaperone [Bacillus thuringiensis]